MSGLLTTCRLESGLPIVGQGWEFQAVAAVQYAYEMQLAATSDFVNLMIDMGDTGVAVRVSGPTISLLPLSAPPMMIKEAAFMDWLRANCSIS